MLAEFDLSLKAKISYNLMHWIAFYGTMLCWYFNIQVKAIVRLSASSYEQWYNFIILNLHLLWSSENKILQGLLQLHVVILWHIILILSKPILWSYSSMLSYSDTLSWFWANQFCVLIPFYCILSRKARNTGTNFIVFGLTTLGHDRMIYCTWGEHANHYTTTCMS